VSQSARQRAAICWSAPITARADARASIAALDRYLVLITASYGTMRGVEQHLAQPVL
jgi:hypothetical protein